MSGISSLLGRVLFSVLPLYIGRRGAAIIGTAISCVIMLSIFTFYREFVGELVGVCAADRVWRGVL